MEDFDRLYFGTPEFIPQSQIPLSQRGLEYQPFSQTLGNSQTIFRIRNEQEADTAARLALQGDPNRLTFSQPENQGFWQGTESYEPVYQPSEDEPLAQEDRLPEEDFLANLNPQQTRNILGAGQLYGQTVIQPENPFGLEIGEQFEGEPFEYIPAEISGPASARLSVATQKTSSTPQSKKRIQRLEKIAVRQVTDPVSVVLEVEAQRQPFSIDQGKTTWRSMGARAQRSQAKRNQIFAVASAFHDSDLQALVDETLPPSDGMNMADYEKEHHNFYLGLSAITGIFGLASIVQEDKFPARQYFGSAALARTALFSEIVFYATRSVDPQQKSTYLDEPYQLLWPWQRACVRASIRTLFQGCPNRAAAMLSSLSYRYASWPKGRIVKPESEVMMISPFDGEEPEFDLKLRQYESSQKFLKSDVLDIPLDPTLAQILEDTHGVFTAINQDNHEWEHNPNAEIYYNRIERIRNMIQDWVEEISKSS